MSLDDDKCGVDLIVFSYKVHIMHISTRCHARNSHSPGDGCDASGGLYMCALARGREGGSE